MIVIKFPKALQITLEFLFVVCLGYFEYITGPEITLSIFYLIPIAISAWFTGRNSGIFISLIAGATWLIVDLASGNVYSKPWILYWNTLVRLGFYLITSLALSLLKKEYDEKRTLANFDFLTGAANSRYFSELAVKEIESAKRYKRPFVLAFIDLDNFKAVNDKFGHSTGDDVLREAVKVIQSGVRSMDIVARLGGDEFVVLFPEIGYEKALKAISRIEEKLLERMKENSWPVTFSIGVADFPVPPISVDAMIKKADLLMYSAKKSNKDMPRRDGKHPYRKTSFEFI
ncbi:MAG: GGDEF domain-containing protein [bacterium]|nr:GGDEF domain-containing protein [bacterium]